MSSAPEKPKRSAFYRWIKRNRFKLNDFGARFSLIPNDPVLEPAQFDWTRSIASHWEDIRDEALAVYRHIDAVPPLRRISADHRRIMADDSWRSFFLIGYGNKFADNIARAPRTAELVQQIPNLNSAFFSILGPGSHIARHRGVTKSFFTAHLGLRVPSSSAGCRMQVEDQDLHWQEGKWILFDDTYEHEVWNTTEESRIILLCQVGRPLRAPGSWMASLFNWYIRRSPFVTEAKREMAFWEDAYRNAEQRGAGNQT